MDVLAALADVFEAGAKHARGYSMSIDSMKQAELLEVMAKKARAISERTDG